MGTVFESDVILKYLEDLYGNNEAMTPDTAEGRQVMNLFTELHDDTKFAELLRGRAFAHSQGAMYLPQNGTARGGDGHRNPRSQDRRDFQTIDLARGEQGGRFMPLLATALTLADLTWMPTCVFMEFLLPRVFGWADPFGDASPFPRLAAWYQGLLSGRPSRRRGPKFGIRRVEMEKKGQFEPIVAEITAAPERKWTYP